MRVVDLVHMTFRDVRITEEVMWQAIVMFPKGGGDFLGDRPCGGTLEYGVSNPGPPPGIGHCAS